MPILLGSSDEDLRVSFSAVSGLVLLVTGVHTGSRGSMCTNLPFAIRGSSYYQLAAVDGPGSGCGLIPSWHARAASGSSVPVGRGHFKELCQGFEQLVVNQAPSNENAGSYAPVPDVRPDRQ